MTAIGWKPLQDFCEKNLPSCVGCLNILDLRGNRRIVQVANRILYFIALLIAAWCCMTLTHEAGHVLGGWCSGGTLIAYDLRPWKLPYSLFAPDPQPLVTLWAGPLLGVLVPLAFAATVRRDGVWFIAHFCMLANGVYLAAAWISQDPYLDTPRLLQEGAHPASIAIYCAVTIGLGYFAFRRSCIALLSPPAAPQAKPQNAPPVDRTQT